MGVPVKNNDNNDNFVLKIDHNNLVALYVLYICVDVVGRIWLKGVAGLSEIIVERCKH